MAGNKYSRGRKLVALCGITTASNIQEELERSDEYICDLNTLFSDDYSMEFLSSPVRPTRVHENSTPNHPSNDNSTGLIFTDISYRSSGNCHGNTETSPVAATAENNNISSCLTVPSVWLENNSLNTPQLNSMFLDNDHGDISSEIQEIPTTRSLANITAPLNENFEATSFTENNPEPSAVEDNFTLVLNHETGTFEKNYTGAEQTLGEIEEPSLLPSKIHENQRLRVLGKTYKGLKRKRDASTSNVYSVDVVKRNRTLKEKSCPHGAEQKSDRSFLCAVISDEIRKDIFHFFWQLPTWQAKKAYINGLVQLRGTLKRRQHEAPQESTSTKKNYGFDCFLPGQNGKKIRVCKSFFLATLDLKKDVFQEWVITTGTSTSDSIPHKPRKIDRRIISQPKELKSVSVDKWLEKIPVLPSHFCRADSSRTYVEDTFQSETHMHKVYSKWCEDNNLKAVSRKPFMKKLKSKKISIYKPRKDQCDTCVAYKEGNISEEAYNLHIIKKNEARDAKKTAINEMSSTVLVLTMDMQSVLLCPKLLVSEQYYKQKLAIHNFTIYVKNNKNVYLYVWHEGEGGVTANNITSCIVHFIREYCTSYQKVCLISDGCSYQNRNKVLSSALSNASTSLGIEIEQLILEKGHTMMEADSVHSTLEGQFKPPIFSPTDYITRMRQARPSQPYEVKYLDYTFFKNYEDVNGNFSSIRPGKRAGDPTVTDIRCLWYKDGVVKYKLRHSESYKLLPQRRCRPENQEEPQQLYDSRPKIDSSKYNSLQSLKSYMHKDYHYFYDNLNV